MQCSPAPHTLHSGVARYVLSQAFGRKSSAHRKRRSNARLSRCMHHTCVPAACMVVCMLEAVMACRELRREKKYNYEVQSTGEVITFAGLYAADKGQAAAVTFYTFFGWAFLECGQEQCKVGYTRKPTWIAHSGAITGHTNVRLNYYSPK
eukprot:364426-Chlamydomonas_euryale.AAC.32